MNGIRRYDLAADEYHLLKPGEYMKGPHHWWARVPINASFPKGAVANLAAHDVVEHVDGTISVSPSILVTGGGSWHGFLERGIWREV
jgi:hypothetical protein